MDPPNELSWVIWAATSPYSPLNLHYLPQPVPADAPLARQNGVFTFEDAFEDLLAVSSGKKLPDINAKYESRKLLRGMFPDGEDASFWVRRLSSQRLLDNANFFHFQPRPFWPHDVWDSIHREFSRAADEAKRAEERWLSHHFEDEERRERRSRDGRPHGLFDELDRLFRSFESGMNGERQEEDQRQKKKETQKEMQTEEGREKGRDADTFDELYSSVQSAFSSGAKSLGTLVKIAMDGMADFQKTQSSDSWRGERNGEREVERIESKEEHTDEAGNLHEKRTIRILDGDGREIGQEVHVRITSPRPKQQSGPHAEVPSEKTPLEEKPDGNKSSSDKEGSSGNDSGWFWK
ncbi:uncharacterized protein DNG_01389 [Cephalotrichum gorgonifer]|uniref:Uncharacterized protein n=1 Tax=Cephalotrichum gorgonifer TaxID=2041049 RepID=A0AAE8SRM3_9PEZI|nr:uncharacterized protein DNG_01389 [Cephalotrichum gorgonifer]